MRGVFVCERKPYRKGGVVAMGASAGNPTNRYARLGVGKPDAERATWEDAEQEDVWRTICKVTDAGDGITFSHTKDGGAVSIVILSGDERIRLYARGAEEIKERLREIREQLDATD
jgi:hypothetical protein